MLPEERLRLLALCATVVAVYATAVWLGNVVVSWRVEILDKTQKTPRSALEIGRSRAKEVT
jgi:hypothetical protein